MERRIQRVQSRRHLLDFIHYVKDDYISNWFHEAVCKELEQFYIDVQAGKSPRLMIWAPPRHGKTELVSRSFPAWLFGINPKIHIMGCSYAADLSNKNNRDIQRIIDTPKYAEVFPGTMLNTKNVQTISGNPLRNATTFEIVNSLGSYHNAGIGGSITGMGFDIGIIDDPIKDADEASSQVVRDNIWDWYLSTFFTRKSTKSGILIIMTRWHLDDLCGRLLNQEPEKWKVLSYEAIASNDELHRKAGEALHPERYSLADLKDIRSTLTPYQWSSLYQQNPIPQGGAIIKREQINVLDGQIEESESVVRRWDLASIEGGGDWTVGLRMEKNKGRFIITDMVRLQGSPAQVEASIKQTAELDGRECRICIPQDPGQAGKVQSEYLIKSLAGYIVTRVRETGSKIKRLEPLASQVAIGNVFMLKAKWNKELLDEISTFPSGEHDDIVDACSGAFSELINGRIELMFERPSSEITKELPEIKDWWPRVCGLYISPQEYVAVWIAHNLDMDVFWVYDIHKLSTDIFTTSAVLRSKGDYIPVVWGVDGYKESSQIATQLHATGLDILLTPSTFEDGKFDLEGAFMRLSEKIKLGKIMINKDLKPLINEYDILHRMDGKLNTSPFMTAFVYAFTMNRYANVKTQTNPGSHGQFMDGY